MTKCPVLTMGVRLDSGVLIASLARVVDSSSDSADGEGDAYGSQAFRSAHALRNLRHSFQIFGPFERLHGFGPITFRATVGGLVQQSTIYQCVVCGFDSSEHA